MSSRSGKVLLLSSLIAAVFAVLLVSVPTAFGQPVGVAAGSLSSAVSNGKAPYAGYLGVVISGNLSKQTAEFNVPSVTCQASLPEAQIVGVDAGASGVLDNGTTVQVGENLNTICDRNSSTPRFAPLAYDCLVGACTTLTVFSLPVSAGDNVSFTITANTTSGQVVWSMADLTTKVSKSYHHDFGTGINLTRPFWEVGGPNYPCTPTSCSQALAKFSGSILLRDCGLTVLGKRVHVGALAYLIHYTMVDSIGNVLARASAIMRAGSAFSGVWVRST